MTTTLHFSVTSHLVLISVSFPGSFSGSSPATHKLYYAIKTLGEALVNEVVPDHNSSTLASFPVSPLQNVNMTIVKMGRGWYFFLP